MTVDELTVALQSKPHLTAAIVAVRDSPALGKDKKMEEITRIIREDGEAESSQKQSPLASLARPPKLSALEEAQAAWRPSPEQKEAARAALVEQRSRVELAETRRLASPPGRVWSSFGGHCIERGGMLDFVDLVDARYLISLSEHSGVVPRWQDVPDCARINRSNIWRLWGWERMFSLGILVLSCEPRESTLKPGLPHLSFASANEPSVRVSSATDPWLDSDHPDRIGEQLGRIVPILRCMLEFCGGEEFTCGVLWE